ncbi:hypothetical protein VNO78_05726 [Psophocarpus tetragonolobus]|uniref:Uncharacterized protein n=1 Tax=Psophocarpus tetragonolobus TaxID=3891 RepID=A0AAN9XRC2_PSOTE
MSLVGHNEISITCPFRKESHKVFLEKQLKALQNGTIEGIGIDEGMGPIVEIGVKIKCDNIELHFTSTLFSNEGRVVRTSEEESKCHKAKDLKCLKCLRHLNATVEYARNFEGIGLLIQVGQHVVDICHLTQSQVMDVAELAGVDTGSFDPLVKLCDHQALIEGDINSMWACK